jgi:hypothetical protein
MASMFGQFAFLAAALFAGAAFYVSFAEHPARLELDDNAALAQWQESYPRGALMQATLALIGSVLGVLEWIVTSDYFWLLGALVLFANWPYTFISIMPTNRALEALPIHDAGPDARPTLERWGRLHALRTVLGLISVGLFLWASL